MISLSAYFFRKHKGHLIRDALLLFSSVDLSAFVIVRMDRLDRAVFCDVELCELNASLV
jgi:hypothetical protein